MNKEKHTSINRCLHNGFFFTGCLMGVRRGSPNPAEVGGYPQRNRRWSEVARTHTHTHTGQTHTEPLTQFLMLTPTIFARTLIWPFLSEAMSCQPLPKAHEHRWGLEHRLTAKWRSLTSKHSSFTFTAVHWPQYQDAQEFALLCRCNLAHASQRNKGKIKCVMLWHTGTPWFVCRPSRQDRMCDKMSHIWRHSFCMKVKSVLHFLALLLV